MSASAIRSADSTLYDRRDDLRKFTDSLREYAEWLDSAEPVQYASLDSRSEQLAVIRLLEKSRTGFSEVISSIDRTIAKIRALKVSHGRRRA